MSGVKGRSGRIPRPAALKLVEGRAPGRDSGGRPVPLPPAFIREAPEPPADLTDVEQALWGLVVDDLGPLELLKNSDHGILLLYCHTWSQYFAAKRLADAGLMVKDKRQVGTPKETEVWRRNPAVSIMAECRRDLIRIGAELGLSPSAEQRLGGAFNDGVGNYDDEPNPFDWYARHGSSD